MSVGEPQAMREEAQALPADGTVLSNSFRLSIRQWLVVGLFSMLVVVVRATALETSREFSA